MFQKRNNVFVRVTQVERVDTAAHTIHTPVGALRYDFLVIAIGADTNWYGNERVRANAIPMKSVSEALYLRNHIFEDYENAVTAADTEEKQRFLDIVIVGGGPTGVEVAGALAEMRNHIIPKDYHDLSQQQIDIHLVHGNDRLLNTMSDESSTAAEAFLRQMGVRLHLDRVVKDYDGQTVYMDDGSELYSEKVIWAAGIIGNTLAGLDASAIVRGNRIRVNAYNQVEGLENVFAIGDIAFQTTDAAFPNGHPQVAQVAIQHAANLAKNMSVWAFQKGELRPFRYKDLGNMATIGRHKAVVDLPFWKFQGALAWFAWLFVHLFALIGTKNKVFVFINWVWNYLTYDQSLRLVIKPYKK